jgi:UDP-glucose 4-epimerase
VTIYDALEPRSGGNLSNLEGIADRVAIVLKDIRNFDAVSEAVKGQHIIFNCAAHTSHPDSMKEPWLDLEVNCAGVINVLEAARRCNKRVKIVHVGTSSQIGRMKENPVTEEHSEFPLDIYSANKTASEKYVLIYANAYKIPATVVRLPNVYGPRSNIRSSEFGFINYFFGLALQNKNLTVYGAGQQLRNLIYIEDAVKALLLATKIASSKPEVLFASADHQVSIMKIAETIVKIFGRGRVKNVKWPEPRKSIEIGDAVISNRKIKRLLGWRPQWNLEKGLIETERYFSPRIEAYLKIKTRRMQG